MKRIITAAVLLLGLGILISCDKDSATSKSLVGKWQFTHLELTTTSGEVIKQTLDATIFWTFTDKMVTMQDGDNSNTWSYTYDDDGALLINTIFKTRVSEGNLFNVEKVDKSELVLYEPTSSDYPMMVNGQTVRVVKADIVFKRVN